MVTATGPNATSALQFLEDDQLNGNSPLPSGGVTAREPSALTESGLDRRVDRLAHWSAALARGDDAEVDRLVRQSRVDRIWVAASGQLGAMLG